MARRRSLGRLTPRPPARRPPSLPPPLLHPPTPLHARTHTPQVGKKLPRARNHTDTTFKSQAISLPEQSVAADKSGVATTARNLTLKELLAQTAHYSERVRREALVGLAELLAAHPGGWVGRGRGEGVSSTRSLLLVLQLQLLLPPLCPLPRACRDWVPASPPTQTSCGAMRLW